MTTQHLALVFMVPGQPHPAERPRHRGRVAYTPARTLDAEDRVGGAYIAKLAEQGRPAGRFVGEVSVALSFMRATRRRVDLDNLAKTVLDGLTKAGAWDDDSQVAHLTLDRWLAQPDPFTRVQIVGQYATLDDMTPREDPSP